MAHNANGRLAILQEFAVTISVIFKYQSVRKQKEEKMPKQPHVVVVGGGFGGLNVVKALQTAPVQITLVDRHNYHLFRPLLYQVAMAGLSPGDIASPLRVIFKRRFHVRTFLAKVVIWMSNTVRLIFADRGKPGL